MSHADAVGKALPLAAAAIAVAGEGTAIAASTSGSARWNEAAVAAVVIAYAAVGVLVLWFRPGHPIGRIATVIAPVWGIGEALVALSYRGLQADPGDQLATWGSVIGGTLRGIPWLVAVLWLPLVFPDGEPARDRADVVARRFSGITLVLFLIASLFPDKLPDTRVDHIDNPLGAPGFLADVVGFLQALVLLLGVVAIGMAVAALVRRYRAGSSLTRQQTLIFGIAFVPPIINLVLSASDSADPWTFGLASIWVPIAIGVAVLQRRLYDLPLLASRSISAALLWVSIAALYALTVGGVGAMMRSRGADWLPWLAAGVVAVSFAPLRAALQGSANRLVYGQWAQPTEVLAGTARRLGDATDVPALLTDLVEDLGAALDLDYVEITDTAGVTLAVRGRRPEHVDQAPMAAYGVPVGALAWTHRPLRESDRALLADLTRQLGTVVHAAGLLASVQAARERLVLAREEERRRLRRELHDGVGPALAGLTLQVDTLRNRRADISEDDLLRLRDGIVSTVLDVRRIVEGLRPAALDDLGLVPAIETLVDRLGLPGDLEVVQLPALSAATEVAVYRIVQEALANAARHADAQRVSIRLCGSSDTLRVEICDDGSGVVVPRPDGVGLSSMRSRAEEIGGRFELAATPGQGTRVVATLPSGARS